MPTHLTLSAQADSGFETRRKPTRRDVFLAEMDKAAPWPALCEVIEPFYPKARAEGGRRPAGLERMLRIHFLQPWYALSDPAVEEALYASASMRRFAGIDLGREPVPDETTVCRFRHLLEKHGLADRLFKAVNQPLHQHGLKLSQGTIVDATILGAASSTKNRAKARDPGMRSTRKGRPWYFGMKAHIGVDAATGLVHSMVTTAANVADVTQGGRLLHGRENAVFGDAGDTGAARHAQPRRGRHWPIAARRATVKAITDVKRRALTEAKGARQGVDTGRSRAPVPGHQAAVWPCKSALPWPGQEWRSGDDTVCAEPSVDGSPLFSGPGQDKCACRAHCRAETRQKRKRALQKRGLYRSVTLWRGRTGSRLSREQDDQTILKGGADLLKLVHSSLS